jgi:ADP-heptose:LPS heptosyltransferase
VRIMLLCLDNLGDLVFASSLVPPLQKFAPEASWAIFCKAYAEAIAQAFPVAAQVIAADPPWDDSPGGGRGSYLKFLRAVGRARRLQPDVILVASKNWRAAATAYLIGGKTRIGFIGSKSRLFLTDKVSRDGWQTTPVTAMLARLLEPLGVQWQDATPPPVVLQVPTGHASLVTTPGHRYVMLHPFAGDLRRCWPLEQWGALAAKIRDSGYGIVWMGRADEAGKIKALIPEAMRDTFMWQLGEQKLASTLAVTAKASALVGHDSGPIHFATALGVPVLGLYLPSEFPRTVCRGLGPHQVLWRKSPADLGPEDVWNNLKALL